MKIQCNVCEVAEANVLCCADEAALCLTCDEKVHAANKLASKHKRIPLISSPSQIPKCDICQEATGFFFCLEDRAVLCRKCDVSIHTANTFVSAHQRFLLTGVKVGLEPTDAGSTSSSAKPPSGAKITETKFSLSSGKSMSTPVNCECNTALPVHAGDVGNIMSTKLSFAGGSTSGSISHWNVDDFFGSTDFNQNYGYVDNGSSKADCDIHGDSDFSPVSRPTNGELDNDECLGQVPDMSYIVPQIPSPPTASGLYWPKYSFCLSDNAVFVPDICCSPVQNPLPGQ